MGTRSTYRVIETYKNDKGVKIEKKIVLVYLQYDGYPDGHPLEIAEWLSTGKVVNGLGLKTEGLPLVFNGAGCLAAQLIHKLKDGPGGTYIYPISDRGKCGENYVYDIIVDFDTKEITFNAYDNPWKGRPKLIFSGYPKDFVYKYEKKEVEK